MYWSGVCMLIMFAIKSISQEYVTYQRTSRVNDHIWTTYEEKMQVLSLIR